MTSGKSTRGTLKSARQLIRAKVRDLNLKAKARERAHQARTAGAP